MDAKIESISLGDDQVWADILGGIEVTEPSGDLLVSVGRPIVEKLVLLAVAKKIGTSFATVKAAGNIGFGYEVNDHGDRGDLGEVDVRFRVTAKQPV